MLASLTDPRKTTEEQARVLIQTATPVYWITSALSNRAQGVAAPLGQGHVVSFAIRPFWRWRTQGSYFLGFNTILTGTT